MWFYSFSVLLPEKTIDGERDVALHILDTKIQYINVKGLSPKIKPCKTERDIPKLKAAPAVCCYTILQSIYNDGLS